jgi:starch-binding outer membrane protein SusE/F
MKNTLKILVALFLFIGISSCEKEENFEILNAQEADFKILTPDTNKTILLNVGTASNTALTLSWEPVSYGTPTTVNYTVQFAKQGTNFATPTDISTSSNTNFSMDGLALNSKALALGLIPQSSAAIEVRIKSTVGSPGTLEKFSSSVILLVTPYSTELPKIYVIGGFLNASGYGSDWTPANTLPALASSAFGATDFEGYVNFDNPASQYKFLPQNTSFDGDYGDTGASDGSYSGTIEQTGEVNAGLPSSSGAGYYLVKVNTTSLEYSLMKQTWRIIGFARTGDDSGWNNDTDMTYDKVTKKWSAVLNLFPGKFKFRANADWNNAINNFGVDSDGKLKYNAGDITFTGAAGSYKVSLDLSNPRDYKYTIVPN